MFIEKRKIFPYSLMAYKQKGEKSLIVIVFQLRDVDSHEEYQIFTNAFNVIKFCSALPIVLLKYV